MSHALGIDIGGTKIAAGVVDDHGAILESASIPTPKTHADDVLAAILSLVDDLGALHGFDSIGIAAAGWMDRTRERVVFAPHLPWRDEPLVRRIREASSLPVVMDNDANATAWAEHRFGVAQGIADFVMVAVGTGIGGGIVANHQLVRGSHGMAGEIGHIRLEIDGRDCPCGQRGCWEQYASGNALGRIARELAERGEADSLVRLAGSIDAITGRTVAEAWQNNSTEAQRAINECAQWLGRGMATLAAVLDPSLLVLGGGLSELGDVLIHPTRSSFAAHAMGGNSREQPEIVVAALGPQAAIIGAAEMSRDSLTST